MKFLHAFIITILLSGCGTINEHQNITQTQNELQTASVGSTLLRINKQGDLPNVFGGADIWGGKVDKGYTEVKLKAIHGGKVDLLVFDVNRESTESTLTRYRAVGGVNVSQTVNTVEGSEGPTPVTLDTKNEPDYIISGVKITFIEVRGSSVIYRITKFQSNKND